MPVVTMADYNTNKTSGSWKDRNCPNMRTCWSFSWQAYDLRMSDKKALLRRVAMCLTLVIRTFLSILGIVRNSYGSLLVSVIVGTILTILNFFFIGWCLAKIGEAEGQRRVFGKLVGRLHFDIFLGFCAVIHIVLLLSAFIAWSGFGGAGLNGTWLAMWLLIFAVAWITTWAPEEDINV
ncbi:hypothetical protein N0V84_011104 [Fusarium piperis]|uniref:Uncharacterized protein n=1 Tax=Fusarium piperis TaxID=1435070 RepID=A0A9W8TCS2_9HYPO|nr:hypothetical protein N0V84_011104 [Fusarium piperis]